MHKNIPCSGVKAQISERLSDEFIDKIGLSELKMRPNACFSFNLDTHRLPNIVDFACFSKLFRNDCLGAEYGLLLT